MKIPSFFQTLRFAALAVGLAFGVFFAGQARANYIDGANLYEGYFAWKISSDSSGAFTIHTGKVADGQNQPGVPPNGDAISFNWSRPDWTSNYNNPNGFFVEEIKIQWSLGSVNEESISSGHIGAIFLGNATGSIVFRPSISNAKITDQNGSRPWEKAYNDYFTDHQYSQGADGIWRTPDGNTWEQNPGDRQRLWPFLVAERASFGSVTGSVSVDVKYTEYPCSGSSISTNNLVNWHRVASGDYDDRYRNQPVGAKTTVSLDQFQFNPGRTESGNADFSVE